MLELGASFKKARESQNVSIDRIAAETRISTRFLLAIENEQFDILPGGIFNRGFIRTYAERLGIDPEEAIRSYEKSARVVEPESPKQEAPKVLDKSPKIPVYYAVVGVFLILVAAFYIWSRPSEPSISTAVAASPSTTETSPAPQPVPAPKSHNTPAELVASTGPVAVSAAAVKSPIEAIVPASAVPSPNTTTANSPVVVELQVSEESWFQLVSDGNSVVAGEVLSAGTMRRYTANNSMDVSIGNAAGIKLRVNGQPVSYLGRSGQVRKMTITPSTSAVSLAAKAAE